MENLPDTLETIMGKTPKEPIIFIRSLSLSSMTYDSMNNHIQSLKKQSAMIYASCLHIESLLKENLKLHTTESAQEMNVQIDPAPNP